MENNLFISYDLYSPGQDYSLVIDEVKKLGNWTKIHKSYWYVNSTFKAEQAAKRVSVKIDFNDSLMVVDATDNNGCWYNLSQGHNICFNHKSPGFNRTAYALLRQSFIVALNS